MEHVPASLGKARRPEEQLITDAAGVLYFIPR